MSKIKICTDSASDVSVELANELGIELLCFPITVGDKGYREQLTSQQPNFMKFSKMPLTFRTPHRLLFSITARFTRRITTRVTQTLSL